ncbi:predicted protein, partial [Nematostella vectensis]
NDMERELAEIEKRRLEGKLSYEDAILARQNLIKDNKQKVSEIKKQTVDFFIFKPMDDDKPFSSISLLFEHEIKHLYGHMAFPYLAFVDKTPYIVIWPSLIWHL